MTGSTMPRTEAEQLADAVLRGLRPLVVQLLEAALAEPADDDALTAADLARIDALVERRRQRLLQSQAKPNSVTPAKRATRRRRSERTS